MGNRKIFALLAVLFFVALILLSSSLLQDLLFSSIDFLGEYFKENKALGIIIFFVFSAVSVLLSPFTSVPFVPSAIMAWGNFLTFLILFLGWVTGGVFAYLVGSFSREKIIKKIFSFGKIERYKKRISPQTQFWLVLLFRLAIPSEIAGYTLGIIRYQFKKYLLATFLAELPFAFFVIYSSSVLLSGEILLFAGILLAGTIVFFLLYRAFHKKIKIC